MRSGFTTGSCAAAAAKAATIMLLSDTKVSVINITTPKGEVFEANILDIEKAENFVSCCVIKDGGDDPDITTGAHIYARATIESEGKREVSIVGGKGVGIVTKPGLDQGVGEYAINSVPRQMIRSAVLDVCDSLSIDAHIVITISVPEGIELAAKTFNPRLGIEGGISIIGTSGVVEPMSTKAIVDTIGLELRQRRTLGDTQIVVTPGNYGRQFIRDNFNYDIDCCVKSSNYIGKTIDMVCELGFEKMLLIGHVGKLIKLAGGIMNTHSGEADCRMEILAAACVKENVDISIINEIVNCLTTQEAIDILTEWDSSRLNNIMSYIMERIIFYMNKRSNDNVKIECIMYSNENGILAMSKGAREWLTLLGQEAEA